MALMEANDPKNVLVMKSAKHKQELEDEVKLISANTQKIITNTLVIGGTLAVTYFIARQFSGWKANQKSETKKVKSESDAQVDPSSTQDDSAPGIVSQIGSALATQATVFLLDLAKDKLGAFVSTHFNNKRAETPDERS